MVLKWIWTSFSCKVVSLSWLWVWLRPVFSKREKESAWKKHGPTQSRSRGPWAGPGLATFFMRKAWQSTAWHNHEAMGREPGLDRIFYGKRMTRHGPTNYAKFSKIRLMPCPIWESGCILKLFGLARLVSSGLGPWPRPGHAPQPSLDVSSMGNGNPTRKRQSLANVCVNRPSFTLKQNSEENWLKLIRPRDKIWLHYYDLY